MPAKKLVSFTAALIGTPTLIPVVATLSTAALFIVVSPRTATPQMLDPRLIATVGGIILALMIWVLAALFYLPYTTARTAEIYSFNLLSNRLSRLETWISTIMKSTHTDDSPPEFQEAYDAISRNELRSYTMVAKDTLTPKDDQTLREGLVWISAIGYVNISRLLHRAEEALLMVEPSSAVIADGSRVEVAIMNSAIGNQEYYLQTLDKALDYLNPGRLLKFREHTPTSTRSVAPHSKAPGVEVPEPDVATSRERELEARIAIREVTYSFNQFQDDQWEKLVYVRNQLNRMIVLTGLALYILLEFAIVAGLPLPTLISVTIFFLIGAGVGLFSRLYEQSRAESSIGNVRLAVMRLMAAPLFSGLAAIGGVVVMQKVAASSGSPSFDLSLFNILVSAAFGLTPNLFFKTIQKQVESVDKSSKT